MSDLRDLLPTTEAVDAVLHELRHGDIRIGVFGEFSAGKSTFLNALMGEDLLTVAVDPTTATPTRVSYARDFNVLVQGKPGPDGKPVELARLFPDQVPAWARFVGKSGILTMLRREGAQIRSFLERWTKEGADAAQTSAVVLCLPQPFLKDRLCLIDTPGVNNEFALHRQITDQVAAEVDIAVCLLDARQGGKRSERDFIVTVATTAPKTVLVVNKIDCIDEDEREDVVFALHAALRDRWPADRGECPEPWPCSAKAALDPEMAATCGALASDFGALRQRLTDLGAAERGRLILHRTGGIDQTLRTLATEAERIGQLDIAHRALEDCLNLYGEADIDAPALVEQFARVEKALQENLSRLNEAYALLDSAERKLEAQNGVATPEVRDAVLKATLIFRQLNETDERLNLLRQRLNGAPPKPSAAVAASPNREAPTPAAGIGPMDAKAQFELGLKYANGDGVPQDYAQAVAWYRKAADQGNAGAQCNLGVCYYDGHGVPQDFARAVAWYRKAAEQGNAGAQAGLGVCYHTGQGVPQDYAQAVAWYRKAADQGHPQGQSGLGVCYEFGKGVSQHYGQAADWYRKAANQGRANAQFNLGDCYEYGKGLPKDDDLAAAWYRAAADQGHAGAQFKLGFCYDNGQGVPQDFAQAVALYRKAADQGHAGAQCNLGVCYYDGHGVPQDYAQAVVWYRKAAEQGHADGQSWLGVCYEFGKGVPQDFARAVAWYRKAAEQGNADAQHMLGFCHYNGRGAPQDYAQAAAWYRKAADQGNADAQQNLGVCYANGRGVTQDYTQAVAWYRKAAMQGDADAQVNLGYCYHNGQGVAKDLAHAVAWYQKAAEQGHAAAQYMLGFCYYNGRGVPRDYAQAVVWYRKAADQGHAAAQRNLGFCHENGLGFPKDYAKAVVWFRKAAEQGNADAQVNLGYCYYHGHGVPKDHSLSASWYAKAKAQGQG